MEIFSSGSFIKLDQVVNCLLYMRQGPLLPCNEHSTFNLAIVPVTFLSFFTRHRVDKLHNFPNASAAAIELNF